MFALHIIKASSQEQQELNSVELTEKPVLLLFVTKRLFADKSHVSLFFLSQLVCNACIERTAVIPV